MPSDSSRVKVYCACGARFAAPRAALGRRARCPKCGDVIVLRPAARRHPPTASETRQSPDNSSAAHEPAATLDIRCDCGAMLRVPAAATGHRITCPRCAAKVAVSADGSRNAVRAEPEEDDIARLLGGLSEGEALDRAAQPLVGERRSSSTEPDVFRIAPAPDTLERGAFLPEEKGSNRTCPSCGREYPHKTKICVECGVDILTGQTLLTTQDEGLDHVYAYTERIIRVISWVFGFGIYPVASEAFGLRTPWVIRGIALTTVFVSLWYFMAYWYNPTPDPAMANYMLWGGSAEARDEQLQQIGSMLEDVTLDPNFQEEVDRYVAEQKAGEFSNSQMISHMFLHGGVLHLLGNLLFLMVFGSRVNALIGNILTLTLYPILGISAAAIYMASVAEQPLSPMLGASGAIMGLAGMYLVLFPVHNVHVAAWWRWWIIGWFRLHMNIFAVRGFWVVLFYIAFDVVYTVLGINTGTAHWAHLGGFLTGATLALILLFSRLVNARGGDILTAILGKRAWGLIGKPNRPAISLW